MKIISILIISAMFFGCSGSKTIPTTPKDTAKRFAQAIEDGDCAWFVNYQMYFMKTAPEKYSNRSEDELLKKCQEGMKQEKVKKGENQPALKEILVKSEQIDGDRATVSLMIERAGNIATPMEYRLKKVGEYWEIQGFW